VEYAPGTTVDVTLHDGSRLRLRKLEEGYDPREKIVAVRRLMESHAQSEVLTGVLYVDTSAESFVDRLHLPDRPLATLPQEAVRPPRAVLDEVMESLR
jgi:2-oxoglutarate ferredoxin oxidoreductase subunit beta